MLNNNHPRSSEEFYNLVASAHNWRPVGEGFEVTVPVAADRVVYMLSEVDINAYHPMLFEALHRMVALNKKMRLVERIEGSAVVATLKEWNNPLHISTIDQEDHAVLTIEHVKCSPQHKQVLLTIQKYDVHQFDVNGTSVVVAGNPYRDFPIISAQEMDAIFPGWFIRFKVAAELGYTGRDLVNAVCVRPQLYDHTGMESVSF